MKERTTFDAYVTRYVLTGGIKKIKVSSTSVNSVVVSDKLNGGYIIGIYYHGEGKDWHRTYESALARAKIVKQKKIRSLNKQLEKIKNLTFPEEG